MRARAGDVDVRRRPGGSAMSHGQYAMLPAGSDKRYQLVFRKRRRGRRLDLHRIHHGGQDNRGVYGDTCDHHNYNTQHINFLYFGKNHACKFTHTETGENKLDVDF